MRNESENCGHGRESNPTSSAIAAAALTSELQAIPMVYWHYWSSNLSLFSKFLNLMTISSYFIPWIFTFLINCSIGISPTYENWQPARVITNFSYVSYFSYFSYFSYCHDNYQCLMVGHHPEELPAKPSETCTSSIELVGLINDSSSPAPLITTRVVHFEKQPQ